MGPEIANGRVGWSGPWMDTAPVKGGGGGVLRLLGWGGPNNTSTLMGSVAFFYQMGQSESARTTGACSP